MKLRRAGGFLFSLTLLALPIVVWWQRVAVIDWWRLRGYSPPAEVVSLADAAAMNDFAKRVFYVNHPKVEKNSAQFRSQCPQGEKTIVLGCYRSPQLGIVIYDVTDPRLDGVEEVTAAHEMLHAAYDRLGADEKQKVNNLLNSFYLQLNDARIKETVSLYRQTGPEHVINEMHSIFGTEVSGLPAELESYYSRYFTDRQKVVKAAAGYESEFSSRLEKIAEYEKQLDHLRADIEAQESSLKSQAAGLESDRQRLEALRQSGQIEEYNSQVTAFNAKVNSYNQGVARLRRSINSYNSLLDNYNTIAGELRSLYSAIDTRLTTQSAQ